VRRLGLLLAGAGLWLFLAAIPALADGGPHIATTNNGSLTLTADSCAGCHRAHTAQGPYLLRASSATLLCLSCHGAATTGATVDVTTGVQYRPGTTYVRAGTGDPNAIPSTWVNGAELGATRAGGFLQARLGEPARLVLLTTRGASPFGKVTVSDTPLDVTSAHLALPGSPITAQHIAWGNGVNGSGAGPEVELECTSCHNPHGNGQYRILNPMPSLTSTSGSFTNPIVYDVAGVNGDTGQEYIETTVGHQFFAGDLVTITGVSGITDGDYVVVNVPNGIRIKINTLASWPTATAMNLTTAGAGGTVERTEAPVADVPLGTPDGNGVYPEKNYTVIQIQGTQGTDSSYLLYAQDVIDGGYSATDGDYWRRYVPWNSTTGSYDAPNGKPLTVTSGGGAGDVAFNEQMTAWCVTCHSRYFGYQNPNPGGLPGTSTGQLRAITSVSGGLITVEAASSSSQNYSVGDVVEILGLGADGTYTVATVPSNTTFTVSGGAFADDASPTATAQRTAPVTQSAYFFPRVGDDLFKYQHSTRDNRVCTTCHVAHGSNAVMDGAYSSTLPYPGDTTPSDSSRLLKVGNRGFCTLCHDPTGTVTVGMYTGPDPTPGVP
jgi:predicted CXXCH cytochrome family protein